MNGESSVLLKCGFTRLVQRIFNCDKTEDIHLTPDKVMNSLISGHVLRHHVHESYKLSNMVGFLWLKLIGIFGVVWFLWTYAKNI